MQCTENVCNAPPKKLVCPDLSFNGTFIGGGIFPILGFSCPFQGFEKLQRPPMKRSSWEEGWGGGGGGSASPGQPALDPSTQAISTNYWCPKVPGLPHLAQGGEAGSGPEQGFFSWPVTCGWNVAPLAHCLPVAVRPVAGLCGSWQG